MLMKKRGGEEREREGKMHCGLKWCNLLIKRKKRYRINFIRNKFDTILLNLSTTQLFLCKFATDIFVKDKVFNMYL